MSGKLSLFKTSIFAIFLTVDIHYQLINYTSYFSNISSNC